MDVQAYSAYIAGMMNRQIQYTIRGVPAHLDCVLRERAAKYGKSLNTVAVEAMEEGLGLTENVRRYHDLDDLAGTWVDDPDFDAIVAEMDQVDPELWQ